MVRVSPVLPLKSKMYISTLRIVHLLLTILIASQGIFYLLGASEAFSKLSIDAFAEQRRNLDLVIANRFKVIYVAALIAGLITLVLYRNAPNEKVFICTLVTTIFIFADMIIAIKVSIPINNIFSKYPEPITADWHSLQIRWIGSMVLRGVFSAISLVVLLFSFNK